MFEGTETTARRSWDVKQKRSSSGTINNANDFQVGKRLKNLDRLRLIGKNVHHRPLSLECVAQNCAIASQTVERIVLPTVDEAQPSIEAPRVVHFVTIRSEQVS